MVLEEVPKIVVVLEEVPKNVVATIVVRPLRVVTIISDVVTPEEGFVVTVVTSGSVEREC